MIGPSPETSVVSGFAMDPLVYVAAAVIVGIVLIIVTLLKRSQNEAPPEEGAPAAARPRAARVGDVGPAGRRRVRQRMVHRTNLDDDEEDEAEMLGDIALPEGKIGAKKLAKLQMKEQKRQEREAMLQEREEEKKREAKREERRKKEEAKEAALLKEQEEEERLRKEEEEKREYEEYLKLKEAFTVDEEGTHEEELNQDADSLLQEFINYIEEMKVVMLEDLAAHFKIRTQDAIDRVTTLLEEGRLQGVLDDRGKFISITRSELEAVASFIRRRGRVSIVELAESSNNLVNLSPDNTDTLHRLVADRPTTTAAAAAVSAS